MKRYAILLLALALIGTAGLVCAHRVVSATAEAVEVRETVISGDRAAAEGVEVLMPAACGGYKCNWDTVLSIGAENTAETSFSFRARIGSSGDPTERDYTGVRISVITNEGSSLGAPPCAAHSRFIDGDLISQPVTMDPPGVALR